MASSNTNSSLSPSLGRGARGDFLSIILKSPFIPLCQRGIKTPKTGNLEKIGKKFGKPDSSIMLADPA